MPFSIDAGNISWLSAALEHAFPGLSLVAPLELLGEGFSSSAVETPGGLVFLVARTEEAGESYARQAAALPLLKDYLPVAIPDPRFHIRRSADFPFGLLGYPKLAGQPPDPDLLGWPGALELAGQVGELLYFLQHVPAQNFPLEDDFSTRRARWAKQRDFVLPALRESLDPDEYRRVAGWWDELLADDKMGDYVPVVQHGDLWFGNLLLQQERLTGVLDFQDVGVGDPALDFVPQLYLGERFLRAVLQAYEMKGGAVDAGFWHRLRRLWALREFGGLAYSIAHTDRLEFADSIAKIRKGPILSPLGLDGWRRYT